MINNTSYRTLNGTLNNTLYQSMNNTLNNTLNSDSKKNEKEYDSENMVGIIFLIILCSPFICIIIYCIYNSVKEGLFSINNCIKNKIKECFKKKKISKINDNQLSKEFIQSLNKNNRLGIKENKIDCPICLDIINIDDYNSKNFNITFLNCNHVYHTNCLQEWVKQQLNNINKCSCPMCRDIIIDIPNYTVKNISYESSDEENISDFYGI
jgi:hypothetical protein